MRPLRSLSVLVPMFCEGATIQRLLNDVEAVEIGFTVQVLAWGTA